MTKQQEFHWDVITSMTLKLADQVRKSNWRPDYIVGLTRGGLVPAVLLSHELDVPCETLKVALRDGEEQESCYWMAEDAYEGKKILIVDDINDTGATFKWIREDWPAGCLPGHPNWDTVWNQNVRFAVMCEKTHTKFDGVDYIWEEIDTSEKDTWLVFPWEYD